MNLGKRAYDNWVTRGPQDDCEFDADDEACLACVKYDECLEANS